MVLKVATWNCYEFLILMMTLVTPMYCRWLDFVKEKYHCTLETHIPDQAKFDFAVAGMCTEMLLGNNCEPHGVSLMVTYLVESTLVVITVSQLSSSMSSYRCRSSNN